MSASALSAIPRRCTNYTVKVKLSSRSPERLARRGNRFPIVECAAFRSAGLQAISDGTRLLSSDLQAWTAAVLDSNPLLCRPRVGATQHARPKLLPAQKRSFALSVQLKASQPGRIHGVVRSPEHFAAQPVDPSKTTRRIPCLDRVRHVHVVSLVSE
jgi:hypothetical protein